MNLPHKFIWFACDDCAGMQPLVVGRIFPTFPETGENKWRTICHADRVRDFASENLLPFVKSIDRDQAAAFQEGLAVRRCGINGLNPGIDRLRSDLGILGPIWDQSPSQNIQASLLGLRIESNRQYLLGGSDIPTGRGILLGRYRNKIPASKFLLRGGSSISSAHNSNLSQILNPI